MACSKGVSKGAEEEERKLRECMLCHTKGHWRRMQAIFIDMTDTEAAARAGTAAEKHDVRSGRQYGPAGPPGAFRITKSTWEPLPKLECFQLYNLKAA